MNKFKKSWNIFAFLFLAPLALLFAYSYQTYKVSGTTIYDLDDSGNLTISGLFTSADLTATDDLTVTDDTLLTDQVYRRSLTAVAHSTSVSTGEIFWAYLGGSTNAALGAVLVAADAGLGTTEGVAVTVSDNVADLTSWVGVCAVAASTGGIVGIYTSGYVLALTTGTVQEGNTLVNSALGHGYLGADTTPTTGADVGVALGERTGAGLTLIRLR